MVVRFLPPPVERPSASETDRTDLAEVIELRARLPRVIQGVPAAATEATAAVGTSNEARAPAAVVPEALAAAAVADSVRLLARRALSSGELRRELLAQEHTAESVELALEECAASLYLDDLGLARVLAENLRERKGASRSQIRMKLRVRLMPEAIIERALGELSDDAEWELLRAAAADRARKLAGLAPEVAERRLLGFLSRRGWSGEPATRAVREALAQSRSGTGVRFQ